jgi:ABC-type uncharacterized transport system permease subunit
MGWSLLLLRAAVGFYCLAFVVTFVPVLAGTRRMARATPWLAAAGVVAHTGAFVTLGRALGRCPLATFPEVLSALAWAAVIVYLVAWWRYRWEVLHIIIIPLVLVTLLVSKLLPEPVIPVSDPKRAALFHFTAIILGVAALFITFAASLIYLVVDRALKAKRPPRFFFALPALEQCDKVGRISLLWAFPILTLVIITGVMYNTSLNRPPWSLEPRETLAMISWAVLGGVVVARIGWGWRGRKAAILTIVGFVAVFLRVLGA